MRSSGDVELKPVRWVGSSLGDLREFAQVGLRAFYAKPLKGFGGAGVLEVLSDIGGDTYRAVYRALSRGCLCSARVPEEVETGNRHAHGGPAADSATAQTSR